MSAKKDSPLLPILAIAAGVWLLAAGGNAQFKLTDLAVPGLSWPAAAVDIEPLPTPSDEMRVAVEPLIGMVDSAQGRAELTALYSALAHAIGRDRDRIRTTAQAHALHMAVGDIYFTKNDRQLDDLARGLAGALNGAFIAAAGVDRDIDGVVVRRLPGATFDDASRARCVSAILAVAWAFEQ